MDLVTLMGHHRCLRHLSADGDPAVVDDNKAALPWCASGEGSLGESGGGGSWGHGDRSTDECVDGGLISEDAEESLDATATWLSSAGLKGLESGEPVGGGSDDGGGRSYGESGGGREEGDKVVCDEVLVGVRDGELSWAGSGTVDDSRDMDIESGQALGSEVEEAVSRQDADQSKRLMSTDESVLVGEGVGNSSHSSVGKGAFLVIEGHGDGRHF
jgi:hypothetical protein